MVFESPQSESRFESYGQNSKMGKNRTECDSHPDFSFSGNNNYPVRPALVDATRTQFYHFLEIANTQCDPHRPVRPAPAKSRDCSEDRWITAVTSRCTWVRSAPMDATRSGSNQWPRFTVQDTETRVRLALTGATRIHMCDSHPNLTVSDIKGILARIFHSNFQFPPFFTLLLRSRSRD